MSRTLCFINNNYYYFLHLVCILSTLPLEMREFSFSVPKVPIQENFLAILSAVVGIGIAWRFRHSILRVCGCQRASRKLKGNKYNSTKNNNDDEDEEGDGLQFQNPATFAFACAIHEVEEQQFNPLKATLEEIRGIVCVLRAAPSSSTTTTLPQGESVIPSSSSFSQEEQKGGESQGEVKEGGQGELSFACPPLLSPSIPSTINISPVNSSLTPKRTKGSPTTAHGVPSTSASSFPATPTTSATRSDEKRHYSQQVVRLQKLILLCNELLTRYMISLDELPVAGEPELRASRRALLVSATEWSQEIAEYHRQYIAPSC